MDTSHTLPLRQVEAFWASWWPPGRRGAGQRSKGRGAMGGGGAMGGRRGAAGRWGAGAAAGLLALGGGAEGGAGAEAGLQLLAADWEGRTGAHGGMAWLAGASPHPPGGGAEGCTDGSLSEEKVWPSGGHWVKGDYGLGLGGGRTLRS